MNSISNEQLLAALHWRYATKMFDATKKIPAEVMTTLEQALVLTPTNYGLQPYQFLVIADPAKRTELLAHSFNQKQVVEASLLVALASRTEITAADVDRHVRRTAAVRQLPVNALDGYRRMILGDMVNGPRAKMAHEWSTRQTYIALGNLMTCAAVLGVDACPMEGFVPVEYDRLLNLKGSGYTTVVICALGYRAAHDKYAGYPKVRFETKDVVRYI